MLRQKGSYKLTGWELLFCDEHTRGITVLAVNKNSGVACELAFQKIPGKNEAR